MIHPLRKLTADILAEIAEVLMAVAGAIYDREQQESPTEAEPSR